MASHALLTSADGARIISNGTQSYVKVSLTRLLPLWISVGAGGLGLLYIIVVAGARLAKRSMSRQDPLLLPFAGVLALLLPVPLFDLQSIMQLGDLTLASGLLAAATAALSVAMIVGLIQALRHASDRLAGLAAMLAVLQLCLLLTAWGLLPFRLWA